MQVITKKQSKAIAIILAIAMLLSCFSFLQSSVYADETQKKKAPYQEGDDISKAAFYIAVDADDNGTPEKYYYYTEDEIRAYNDTVEFKYDNHGQVQTDTVKGAKLKKLIDNLGGDPGVDQKDSIVYMEHDAYHSAPAQTEYHDTVAGLEDEESGNGSQSGLPARTMIGYTAKTTYEKPDANNVNDKTFTEFKDYLREASPFRGFRQTKTANSAVMKMLIGVVITGNYANYGKGTNTQGGYLLEHYSNVTNEKIADDYSVLGLVAGMKWAAAPQPLAWASAADSTKVIEVDKVTTGAATQKIQYKYKENNFLNLAIDGKTKALTRSDVRKAGDVEIPNKTYKHHEFTYYGYNKPMYLRYQGAWLKDILGNVNAGKKICMVDNSGKTIDITKNIGDYFVAYYYSESKSSSNIANGKRVPLNYDHAVLVNAASAPVEYSDGNTDYVIESGKAPATYQNPKAIVVTDSVTVPAQVKAKLTKYNKATVSWKAVSGATGYTVSYKKSGASKWTSVNTTKTSYTKGSLAKGSKYQFKVRAYKTDSQATIYSDSDSAVVSVTTLKAPTLKAAKSGKSAIRVKYSNISGESGYQIYRSTKAKKGYKKIKTMRTNKTVYKDKKVKRGKTYYYKVRAYKKVDKKNVYGPWSKVKKVKR